MTMALPAKSRYIIMTSVAHRAAFGEETERRTNLDVGPSSILFHREREEVKDFYTNETGGQRLLLH